MSAAGGQRSAVPEARATEGGFAQLRGQAAGESVDALVPRFSEMLQGMRKVFNSGKTKDLRWRRKQLSRVLDLVEEEHERITAAVTADLGGSKMRGIAECNPHACAQFALDHLDEWTRPEVVHTPIEISPTRLGKSVVRKEPKGVVLIIAPWNYPIELALHPVVAAVAAGNCVVVKPSEVSRECARALEDLLGRYLDTECIKVVQGAVAETQALLKLQWDHIFYTGSGDIGRKVMGAAAQFLTPVTLELGGKSPCIVDRSCKLQTAIDRISAAKWYNVGQTCIAPDFVLIDRSIKDKFIEGMKARVKQYYGADPSRSPDWGRIVSERHADRVRELIRSAGGTVVLGGAEEVDVAQRYVPPTMIDMQSCDCPVLQQEIFGPVLPVVGTDSIDQAIASANAVCDRPLALYCFAEDKAVVDKVLGSTLSGGACVNTAMEHVLNPHLPFGGVGASGMGAYHGKAGFDEFTHRRGCVIQETTIKRDAALPPPPYSDAMYSIIMRVMYLGIVPRRHRGHLKLVLRLVACLCAFLAVKRLLR
eukprot:TRINITY_DN2665_c0_g2_i1.p1 TRINITY_DN2665_c0_g2~~TRINITY_DN2665_c0_g2_i1.p1  ORF type:complete len:535 (+),score=171.58 TRINITY_DN2665_c0_g2_i1:80-1684(+)